MDNRDAVKIVRSHKGRTATQELGVRVDKIYIERDKALAIRFQTFFVEEPTKD